MIYKNLLIDLDDTIWDTVSNGKESLEEIYLEYKFDRFFHTFDHFYSIYYPHNCDLWKSYSHGKITKEELILQRFLFPLQSYGIQDESFILELNENFLNKTTQKTRLVPYAREILSYFYGKGYKIIMLSNGFHEVQYKKINYSGLTDYFDYIILSDDIGINKPDPELFHYAMTTTISFPEETIMIGDNWDTDIVGAKNSQIDQIWFNPLCLQTNDFIPTYQIKSLIELKNIL